jgi:hypothetical protein
MEQLTQAYLRDIFDYHPDGYLIWKKSKKPSKNGTRAGSNHDNKYIRIKLNKKKYFAHRAIWIFHHGDNLTIDIDHIDGNGQNNKIENLRVATRSQNCMNTKMRSNNKSGYKGVSWSEYKKKFVATIKVENKIKRLGVFDDAKLAHEAYKQAAAKHFCEFARFG